MDPNFRVNPSRAIYICSQLDDALSDKLIPQIYELRASSDEPITVFINSPGGSTRVLEILVGILKGPDQDGNTPRIITVATGDAASAAAMLLILGDYAIAYEHSIVHCHGVRYSEVRDLTTEDATNFAKYLQRRNRENALLVAKSSIKRLAHRYSTIQDRMETIRSSGSDNRVVELYVSAIAPELSETGLTVAVESASLALETQRTLAAVFKRIKWRDEDTLLERDTKILLALIRHEAKQKKLDGLDEMGMEQLAADYFLLRDYILGGHSETGNNTVNDYGYFFLRLEEFLEYERLQPEPAKQEHYFNRTLVPRITSFWYFTVVLCRKLQQGENVLTAADAYWLGLVDEVQGTSMQGYRKFLEPALPTQPDLPTQNVADQPSVT